MRRTWVFYYTTDANRLQERAIAEGDFILPQRSKIWKNLQEELNNSDITSCGYMLKQDWNEVF